MSDLRILWRRRIAFVAAVAWLLFIWSNSLQTAEESSQVSRGVLAWLVPFLARSGIPEELWHTLIRKLAHMAEFAAAGVLWFAALWSGKEKMSRIYRKCSGAAWLICIAAAVLDETIQKFVPGRSGELRDVCIDAIGSLMGILVMAIVIRIWECRKFTGKV